jgi:ketosteroid isomerase-like protein
MGCGDLVAVWAEASWVSGSAQGEPMTVKVRGIIVWRRESGGVWRVAMEHIA